MTRLARKCKCGTLMLVEVGLSKGGWFGRYGLGQYDEVECIEGCFLGFYLCGKHYNLPTINNITKKAVYCKSCRSVRYLRLFKEMKV